MICPFLSKNMPTDGDHEFVVIHCQQSTCMMYNSSEGVCTLAAIPKAVNELTDLLYNPLVDLVEIARRLEADSHSQATKERP